MTTLHLGVTEASYAHGGKTTGDVAEILEDKYHIFEHFWQLHREKIVAELCGAVVGAFESVVMGAPPPADPHAAAMTEVQQLFNVFLDQREMDALGYPGIPTAASLAGVIPGDAANSSCGVAAELAPTFPRAGVTGIRRRRVG